MKNRETIIAVYMMANRFDGSIYTGVTAHLVWRIQQHKDGTASGFTRKYRCTSLVWWEAHGLIVDAIRREKRIKKWPRQWKINLIEETNPHRRSPTSEISLTAPRDLQPLFSKSKAENPNYESKQTRIQSQASQTWY